MTNPVRRIDAPLASDPTDAKTRARVALIDSARGQGIEVDHASTDRQIRESVLRRLRPLDSLADKSDVWIEAAYDHELARIERGARDDEAQRHLDALAGVNQATAPQTGGKGEAPPAASIDAAQERADEDAREERKAGPPRGATWVRKPS